jgi:hypothetical protein
MTYAAFKALAASGGAIGATYGAAQAAAIAAIAAGSAAALGAGIGGFLLGEAILKGLEQPPVLPDMGEYWAAGVDGGTARVRFDYFQDGNKIFSNLSSQLMPTPVKGVFYSGVAGTAGWYMIDGLGQRQYLVSTTSPVQGTRLEILDIQNTAGQQTQPRTRLPSYAPKNPYLPVPSAPIPVTVPGVPPLPIAPVVVPNPGNDDGEENEERPPGLIVQIPQTGQQFTFTPDGVRESRYNAPNREPFRVPTLVLPPGGKGATPRCCDDGGDEPPEVDLSEIICRLKTLQDEVLNDGFTRTNGQTPTAPSGFYEELDGGFYKVRITVTQRPNNLRIQPSTSPAPDVWYVGWFAWVENGFPSERLPLHFKDQVFLAPERATGFMYQVNAGCLAIGQWQRRVKKPYIDNC